MVATGHRRTPSVLPVCLVFAFSCFGFYAMQSMFVSGSRFFRPASRCGSHQAFKCRPVSNEFDASAPSVDGSPQIPQGAIAGSLAATALLGLVVTVGNYVDSGNAHTDLRQKAPEAIAFGTALAALRMRPKTLKDDKTFVSAWQSFRHPETLPHPALHYKNRVTPETYMPPASVARDAEKEKAAPQESEREQKMEVLRNSASVGGAVGAAAGTVVGAVGGAIGGIVGAPFTFGLSIPTGAAAGATAVADAGKSVGSSAGTYMGYAANEALKMPRNFVNGGNSEDANKES